MADFSVEDIYRVFRVEDRKLPFREWIRKKIKKRKKIKIKKINRSKNGHIDIYA